MTRSPWGRCCDPGQHASTGQAVSACVVGRAPSSPRASQSLLPILSKISCPSGPGRSGTAAKPKRRASMDYYAEPDPDPQPPPPRRGGSGIMIGAVIVLVLAAGGGAFA